MTGYLIRRLLLIIPTLLLVTIIVFCTIRFIPGTAIDQMVAQMQENTTLGVEVTVQNLKHALGLDLPIYVQYAKWLGDLFQGDLGNSLWTGTSVISEISSRLPVTIELAILSLIISLILSIPIGIYSAIRQDTIGDYIGRTIAILFISVPSFWLGTMAIVYPAVWWGWMPPLEYNPFFQNPGENLLQMILPAIILGMLTSGTTMRMTRTMMLEVMRNDYIRTAWAKGLTERVVIFRHALKNAMIPVISIIGLLIPVLIGGTVILEEIFSLPGIGRLLLNSLSRRDYPIVSGISLVVAGFVLFANLLVDLSYAWFDPRIKYK
jgi:peptide/nickel transport system permease protein